MSKMSKMSASSTGGLEALNRMIIGIRSALDEPIVDQGSRHAILAMYADLARKQRFLELQERASLMGNRPPVIQHPSVPHSSQDPTPLHRQRMKEQVMQAVRGQQGMNTATTVSPFSSWDPMTGMNPRATEFVPQKSAARILSEDDGATMAFYGRQRRSLVSPIPAAPNGEDQSIPISTDYRGVTPDSALGSAESSPPGTVWKNHIEALSLALHEHQTRPRPLSYDRESMLRINKEQPCCSVLPSELNPEFIQFSTQRWNPTTWICRLWELEGKPFLPQKGGQEKTRRSSESSSQFGMDRRRSDSWRGSSSRLEGTLPQLEMDARISMQNHMDPNMESVNHPSGLEQV